MSERTILTWEDYPQLGGHTGSNSFQGKKWDAYPGGGTKDNPTYHLSVGGILIIQGDIETLEDAKQMAQDLQDVLDGHVPGFSFPLEDEEYN